MLAFRHFGVRTTPIQPPCNLMHSDDSLDGRWPITIATDGTSKTMVPGVIGSSLPISTLVLLMVRNLTYFVLLCRSLSDRYSHWFPWKSLRGRGWRYPCLQSIWYAYWEDLPGRNLRQLQLCWSRAYGHLCRNTSVLCHAWCVGMGA